jgi:ornithine cyclodeaminase
MDKLEVLFLNQEDVIAAGGLDMDLTLRGVEDAVGLLENKECASPSKTVLRWGDSSSELTGRVNAMPAYVGGSYDMLGIKWISGFPMNPIKFGLPRGIGLIMLNSSESGVPLVIMDGTIISAMRTGAVTGVAAKYLACSDSETVGLIGAGVQNRTQLLAIITAVPTIKRAVVMDISPERVADFIEEMKKQLEIDFEVESTPEGVARQSDILVTATTSLEPIVHEDWWGQGCLYALVGSYEECTTKLIKQADKVVVDNWDELIHRGTQPVAKMHEAGEFPREVLYAELGELINQKKPGRTSDSERIHFCSIGMGIEDVAVATLIYQRALEKGVGQQLKLWEAPYAI